MERLKLKENWHLFLSFIVLLSATIVRVVYSLRSGFILPDEALFYMTTSDFFGNGRLLLCYPTYVLFQLMILGFGSLLGLDNVWKFMGVFPFLSFIFSFGIVFLVWKIVRNKYLTLASVFTVLIFITTTTMLTETPSLFFVMLGIYFTVRKQPLYSALSFSVAVWFREFYVLFLIGNFFLCKQNRRGYILGSLLALPMTLFIAQYFGLNIFSKISILPITLEPLFLHLDLEGTSGQGGVSIVNRILFTPWNSSFGLLFSLTPFLALMAVFSLFKGRKERDILWWNSIFGIVSLLLLNFLILKDSFFVTSSGRYSSLIRFASICFPSVLVLRFDRKMMVISILSLLLIAPLGLSMVQSNLSIDTVNRLSFDYEAPWSRLAREVEGQDVLVYVEPIIRARLFVSDDVVVSFPPENEEEFNLTVERFERIYFYGEKYTNHEVTLEERVPWYYEIVKNKINVSVVWEDGESYLLRWNP